MKDELKGKNPWNQRGGVRENRMPLLVVHYGFLTGILSYENQFFVQFVCCFLFFPYLCTSIYYKRLVSVRAKLILYTLLNN